MIVTTIRALLPVDSLLAVFSASSTNARYHTLPSCINIEVKVNQYHYRPEWPRGFQEVKVPRLHDSRHNQLYPQGNIPGTLFC